MWQCTIVQPRFDKLLSALIYSDLHDISPENYIGHTVHLKKVLWKIFTQFLCIDPWINLKYCLAKTKVGQKCYKLTGFFKDHHFGFC